MPRTDITGEAGFSLPEMLVAMLVGSIIITAALGLLEVTMKRSRDVAVRVDAVQRGRLAMDSITRQLRSQVCLNASTAPLVNASANQVTFYGDLREAPSGPVQVPYEHTLRYEPAGKRIVQEIRTGTMGADGTVSYGWPQSRVLLTDVGPDGATPMFRYYMFNPGVPPALTELTTASAIGANLQKIAKISVRFNARPTMAGGPAGAPTVLYDDVYSRLVDPNRATAAVAPKPECT